MLTKGKLTAYRLLMVISMIIGVIVAVPFRALPFFDGVKNLFLIEELIKYLICPAIILGITCYGWINKYSETERNKATTIFSYLPMVVYLIGILLFMLYTLTFELSKIGTLTRLLLVLSAGGYLCTVIFVAFNLNKISTYLNKLGNIAVDAVFWIIIGLQVFLSYRLVDHYNVAFAKDIRFIHPTLASDPNLVGLLILLLVEVIVIVYFICTMRTDKQVICSFDTDEEEIVIETTFSDEENDYTKTIAEFEEYYASGAVCPCKAKTTDEEVIETKEAVETVNLTDDTINEALNAVTLINDADLQEDNSAEQIIEIKEQIDFQKYALVNDRTELDNLRNLYSDQIDALEQRVTELEVDNIKKEITAEPKEEKAPKKKVFKPTFEQVLEYSMSLQEEDWKIVNKIDPEKKTGTVKFSKDKIPFLILQNTTSEYRITFLATEKKWSNFLVKGKNISVPKNAKGDKWLKYVNKGIGETAVIKSLIRESVKGAYEEEALIAKQKEDLKKAKLEEKKKAKATSKSEVVEG